MYGALESMIRGAVACARVSAPERGCAQQRQRPVCGRFLETAASCLHNVVPERQGRDLPRILAAAALLFVGSGAHGVMPGLENRAEAQTAAWTSTLTPGGRIMDWALRVELR